MNQKIFILPILALAWLFLSGCTTSTSTTIETDTSVSGDVIVYNQDSWKEIISDSCQIFNDGCNECIRESGSVVCAQAVCVEYEKPYCSTNQTPDVLPEIDNLDISSYIGLSIKAAQEKAQKDNRDFRIVEIDGKVQAVTMDYRSGRLNAIIKNDVVIKITIEWQEGKEYIGLTIEDAKKEANDKKAILRVIEIDGKIQSQWDDFQSGRINVSVLSGIVINASIESSSSMKDQAWRMKGRTMLDMEKKLFQEKEEALKKRNEEIKQREEALRIKENLELQKSMQSAWVQQQISVQ